MTCELLSHTFMLAYCRLRSLQLLCLRMCIHANGTWRMPICILHHAGLRKMCILATPA